MDNLKGTSRFDQELLSFDEYSQILDGCNSKMAQYLCLISKTSKKFNLFFESYIFESVKTKIGVLGIDEVKKMLNYKDLRSAMNWCNLNDVIVIRQGNNQVVSKSQFLLAFYKPLISQLKMKSKDWKEKFTALLNGDFSVLIKDETVQVKSNTYKPEAGAGKDFLDQMKNL
ncbi:MAG: hypothetical protein Crog4KO_26080 [Crocinitomicaceae bacterium]